MAIVADRKQCERARRARDARFDGEFFTAVKTTGIYCRPVCPATPPLEKNVEYHDSAISAAQSGFRPCLRCRPDSAPQSCAWQGTQTSFQRAINLIHQGALQNDSVTELATRLGISDRYLRELFTEHLGTSPKKYALYQQCLFAKKLLHESRLPIGDIAFAAGFNSIRRFNEAMRQQLKLAPREIRQQNAEQVVTGELQLKLYYKPPYAWQQLLKFLSLRALQGVEWADDESYSRTIQFADTQGYFTIRNEEKANHLLLTLHLNDYKNLNLIAQRIRAMFDVDAPVQKIDEQLVEVLGGDFDYLYGLRIPGIWSSFEAGVRAVLGQQVTVKQAISLVTTLVAELGVELALPNKQATARLFPEPIAVANSELSFLRMPQARKDALRRLARHFVNTKDAENLDAWHDIKGIGPWTINYCKLRSGNTQTAPDIWLSNDAGVKNALKHLADKQPPLIIDSETAKPYRSYLTFQLWNQLTN